MVYIQSSLQAVPGYLRYSKGCISLLKRRNLVNEVGKVPNKLIIGNSPSPFRYSNLSQSLGCFLLHSSLPLLQWERDTLLATSLHVTWMWIRYDGIWHFTSPKDIQQFATTIWLHQPSVFKWTLPKQIQWARQYPAIHSIVTTLNCADTSHEELKETNVIGLFYLCIKKFPSVNFSFNSHLSRIPTISTYLITCFTSP
jgi:hypothetical protein